MAITWNPDISSLFSLRKYFVLRVKPVEGWSICLRLANNQLAAWINNTYIILDNVTLFYYYCNSITLNT
jgi:hypothetical protein